jgi:hypothetical protein
MEIEECEEKTRLAEFLRSIRAGDFAIGDSFWLNDIEFEVVAKRQRSSE